MSNEGTWIPLLLMLSAGCARVANTSFPVSDEQASAMLRQMRDEPRALERPLVIAGGIHDHGLASGHLGMVYRRISDPDDLVLVVNFVGFDDDTFPECRDHLVRAVQEAFPGADARTTAEVDVIAFSMGGLVARAAAVPHEGARHLAIRRLFTICTPHRGARMAGLPTLDERVTDMREGSSFLIELDCALPDAGFELVAYARLGDAIVGAENSAPAGIDPWWVDTPPMTFAHLRAAHDPRILADIARRLRGEPPLCVPPPQPLPVSTKTRS